MCVVLCRRLFYCDCDFVIEIEKALKYTNFFLIGVTVIVIVTKHPFLLPSIVVVIVIVTMIVIMIVILIVILILILIVIVTKHPFLLPSIVTRLWLWL